MLWKQVILPQLQHLCSRQQLSDILKFRQSCEQAEDSLSQGMEKLQQIHAEATAAGDKGFQVMYFSQLVSFLKQVMHTLLKPVFYYVKVYGLEVIWCPLLASQ